MDDLTSKISELLSDEQSIKQITELASMLGISNPEAQSSLQAMPITEAQNELPFDIAQIMGLLSKYKSTSQNDDNINFLNALKPLLKSEKQERIDKAIRLIRLMSLWPLIKESGIIDSALGGDDFGGIL